MPEARGDNKSPTPLALAVDRNKDVASVQVHDPVVLRHV